MTIIGRIKAFRLGFDRLGVLDVNGKNFKKDYVENVEAYAMKLEDKVKRLTEELAIYKQGGNPAKCKGCINYNNGTYEMECHGCRRYCADLYEEK